ncbi:hypothetical protein [Micromonospora matsumotoense]|uniref:hypothetical protein n=1 Tax=Micromonospora matsumotoense TaxID=121616 RepID=UPI0034075703
MTADLALTLLLASTAVFGLALLSAVAGFGGGVLLLSVFTVLFGLRFAVPMLTLTPLSSNGSRLWLNRYRSKPSDRAFAGVGAASGRGSALLGSVGPLTAPFFLAYGLTRAAYIGTEAAAALPMHLTEIAAYGVGGLLTTGVLFYGVALSPRPWPAPGWARRSSGGSATGCPSCSSKPVS